METLGFTVGYKAVRPSVAKVHTMLQEPLPTTSRQMQRFVNRANFYSGHLPEFARMVAPLRAIGKRSGRLALSTEERAAFDAVNESLRNAVALCGFDPTLPTSRPTTQPTGLHSCCLSCTQTASGVWSSARHA